MQNELLALLMRQADAPKMVYHSSTSGNNYLLSNEHEFKITVISYKGEVLDTYEPTEYMGLNMLEKGRLFLTCVYCYINTGNWR